jgi:hypothetical protein
MLGRGDEHALFHQAGGIADARDVAAHGFDLEPIEVGAAEDDSRARCSGKNAHRDRRAAVQANARAFHGAADCLLTNQSERLSMDLDYSVAENSGCGKKATLRGLRIHRINRCESARLREIYWY